MAAQTLIPILYARDARQSAHWYERLGFTVTGEHRFAPNFPLYLFLRWGDLQVHLSEHLAQEFGATVEDLPWARQVEITDPDGNRWRIGEEV